MSQEELLRPAVVLPRHGRHQLHSSGRRRERQLRSSPLAGPSVSSDDLNSFVEDASPESTTTPSKPYYRPSRISSTPDLHALAAACESTPSVSNAPSPTPLKKHKSSTTLSSYGITLRIRTTTEPLPNLAYRQSSFTPSTSRNPSENWLTSNGTYGITPKFSRLGLGASNVVMPVSASTMKKRPSMTRIQTTDAVTRPAMRTAPSAFTAPITPARNEALLQVRAPLRHRSQSLGAMPILQGDLQINKPLPPRPQTDDPGSKKIKRKISAAFGLRSNSKSNSEETPPLAPVETQKAVEIPPSSPEGIAPQSEPQPTLMKRKKSFFGKRPSFSVALPATAAINVDAPLPHSRQPSSLTVPHRGVSMDVPRPSTSTQSDVSIPPTPKDEPEVSLPETQANSKRTRSRSIIARALTRFRNSSSARSSNEA